MSGRCKREGCEKPVRPQSNREHEYCRMLCRMVDEELTAVQRVCEYFGQCGELYASAVALADALTELDNLDYQVLRMARDTGLSPADYRAVKRGELV